MMNILSVLLRRVRSDKDIDRERQKNKFKTEECQDKRKKERINVSYHVFLGAGIAQSV
jgi:hypothetical protein